MPRCVPVVLLPVLAGYGPSRPARVVPPALDPEAVTAKLTTASSLGAAVGVPLPENGVATFVLE